MTEIEDDKSSLAGSPAKHEQVNPSTYLTDLAARVKTFTILKWGGMPYNVNPLKLAKLGFVNIDVNKIKCTACNIAITLRAHLNFSQDEKNARVWYDKIKKAHSHECPFKISDDPKAKQAWIPFPEYYAKEFVPTNFCILTRKLIVLRWQEIIVALMKTFVSLENLPTLDEASFEKLRSLFYPTDFDNLIACAKSLSAGVLQQPEIVSSKRESAYPVAGLLAICGWRVLKSDQLDGPYTIECASCLRRVESTLIEQQYLPLQVIKQVKVDTSASVEHIVKSSTFEFDLLGFHYKHCFFSASNKLKESAVITLGKLLLMKYKLDPSLTTLMLRALSPSANVQTLDAHALVRASAISKIVQDEITEKIKDRQLVQAVLANHKEDQPILGKRLVRSFEETIEFTKKTLEESQKRIKFFQEQTEIIKKITKSGFQSAQYDQMLQEYNTLKDQGQRFDIIGEPPMRAEEDQQMEEPNAVSEIKEQTESLADDEDRAEQSAQFSAKQPAIEETQQDASQEADEEGEEEAEEEGEQEMEEVADDVQEPLNEPVVEGDDQLADNTPPVDQERPDQQENRDPSVESSEQLEEEEQNEQSEEPNE